MITCKDIARIAGVSTATVTRAFTPHSVIKEDTRQKILKIAEANHYTPNLAARSLKQRSSKTVGIILSDVSNPYYVNVVQCIERRLEYHGYRSLVSFADRNAVSITRALEVMSASRVDGVIIPPEKDLPDTLIKNMQKQGTRFVQLYRNIFPGIDRVLNNNIYGAYIGTNYFISCGHRRILFVHRADDVRVAGFWQSVNENLGETNQCHALAFSDNDEMNRAKLAEAFESIKPTAVFAIAHPVGRIVFHYLWYMGYRIPEDISLLINDNLDWCEMLNISVIEHPYAEIANTATDLLIERIQKNDSAPPQERIITPYIVHRNSIMRI